jgi:hypothetical protein
MTCVSYTNGGATQTSYDVSVDDTTGEYIVTSNTTKQVETGSEQAHPSPAYHGPRPVLFLDGTRVSGIGPRYMTRSSSISLSGAVSPRNAPITISGVAASPATQAFGYHPVKTTNGTFTLSLPLQPGENEFQLAQGSEVIVTFAVTRER